MDKSINEVLKRLTLEEKISLLTGATSMTTAEIERVGIKKKNFADGPHGVRDRTGVSDCVSFPNLCSVGATWDLELTEKMGRALAKDCIDKGVDTLLGPGVNIKRHILCGRNFEYISEDPVLAGEIGAAYVNGLQSLGVDACVKHYALNNQEKDRMTVSVDVDMRTLMELYLKPFEIVVKKSAPKSMMCAYNKLHSIWCSENKFLLSEVLRDMWGYRGLMMSDWCAVHNPPKVFPAGLDLQMPDNPYLTDELKAALETGDITEADIDRAAGRMIKFLSSRPAENTDYNRDELHSTAREVAAAGTVLLKNDDETLPITKEKYQKIAVIGEFGKSPLISGQGSAVVKVHSKYIESPIEELGKILGDSVSIKYMELYKKTSFSEEMLWPKLGEFLDFIKDTDLVLMFAGAMDSEDTEQFDRRTAELNPNYEYFMHHAMKMGKKVVVILQSGSAMILGNWRHQAAAIVQMWLAGEAAGGAVCDVLCGVVNPSGRLSETFPSKMRTDLNYPGNGYTIEYSEKMFVGYRYYDKHPEEIVYPFGHGLSYTDFEYSNIDITRNGDKLIITFDLKNTGDREGAEVVQLYTGNPVSTVVRPEKELRAFKKVKLSAGETKRVTLEVAVKDMGYYNILLKDWVTEPGRYIIYVGASSRDIRLTQSVMIDDKIPYTIDKAGEAVIG